MQKENINQDTLSDSENRLLTTLEKCHIHAQMIDDLISLLPIIIKEKRYKEFTMAIQTAVVVVTVMDIVAVELDKLYSAIDRSTPGVKQIPNPFQLIGEAILNQASTAVQSRVAEKPKIVR